MQGGQFTVQKIRCFNVTERERVTEIISGSTLQLTFKQPPHVKFWGSIERVSVLSQKIIKMLFLVLTIALR